MLIGEYKSKLGEKNRTALPKKFRDELEASLLMTRGYEGCLILLDKSRWQKLIEIVKVRPLINTDVRNTMRFLVGGAQEIETDSQGRFIINDTLIQYAELKTELYFVGIQDWIEIWDEQRWMDKMEQITKSASDIADRLAQAQQL